MGWCPRCNHKLNRENFSEVEGKWQPDKQGVVSSCVLKETRAEVETCPVCGFQEVVDFQQQRQSVPVIPTIFLN